MLILQLFFHQILASKFSLAESLLFEFYYDARFSTTNKTSLPQKLEQINVLENTLPKNIIKFFTFFVNYLDFNYRTALLVLDSIEYGLNNQDCPIKNKQIQAKIKAKEKERLELLGGPGLLPGVKENLIGAITAELKHLRQGKIRFVYPKTETT